MRELFRGVAVGEDETRRTILTTLNETGELIADALKLSEGKKVRVVGEADAPNAREISDAKGADHGVH